MHSHGPGFEFQEQFDSSTTFGKLLTYLKLCSSTQNGKIRMQILLGHGVTVCYISITKYELDSFSRFLAMQEKRSILYALYYALLGICNRVLFNNNRSMWHVTLKQRKENILLFSGRWTRGMVQRDFEVVQQRATSGKCASFHLNFLSLSRHY